MEAENVFFSPILDIEEALQDPQLKSRNMIVAAQHPIAGRYIQIGSPLKLSGMPIDIERLPAPRLGENTEEILKGLGLTESDIINLLEKGIISASKSY